MIQNHLATGLANDIKKQIFIVYLQSLSQNWCILVCFSGIRTEYNDILRKSLRSMVTQENNNQKIPSIWNVIRNMALKKAFVYVLLKVQLSKGQYTYDVHENCLIFMTPHPPLSIYVQNFSTPWHWTSRFKRTPSPLLTHPLQQTMEQ